MESGQFNLSENALRTLEARYLRKDPSGRVIETSRDLFERVARVVAGAERNYGASSQEVAEMAQNFFSLMSNKIFFPNSPTLMNAGGAIGMLSACFVLPVDDSIEGIFESIKHTAQIQKSGGGTGFSFDRLRPTGDYIASSGGRTSGPISFWRVFCEATRAIQQGAFRRGANMGMLSVGHPDVLKFITAKNSLSAFENFNISVKVSNEFMSSLRADPNAPHVVVNPRTGEAYYLPRSLEIGHYTIQDLLPVGTGPGEDVYSRSELWEMIVNGAWATGEPGVCFIDRVNADNPTPSLGRIEATNPCGEQPLLDYEACNLGSVDVSKFVRRGRLDEKSLRESIRLGVRFLDNVIDVGSYLIPQIEDRCRGNRKIGMGVMGLADAMFELGIKYDSEAGLAFGRRIAKLLTDEAFAASEDLARLRGTFPNYSGSIWQTQRGRVMRNATVTTVAPTGTLSILAGCSGGIEPVFALAFCRHILDGQEMLEVNCPFRRFAEKKGIWNEELSRSLARGAHLADVKGIDRQTRDLFVTAHDISPSWHVRMQAAFQDCVDGAISKTINMPSGAAPADVNEVYQLAYDLKCKGVTVYRDGCRSGQPMAREAGGRACPQCRGVLPGDGSCARCPKCGCTICL